uniref:Uncharacterized protein n=1 Tax=Rhizophora mucronata TaxID=61149 RepID=A0A2P2R4U9_RHIMU
MGKSQQVVEESITKSQRKTFLSSQIIYI